MNREDNLIAQARRGMKRHEIPEYPAVDVLATAFFSHGKNLTLGWSGGRCSTIVLHMALQINPDVQVLFNNTGIEFPENVEYVHKVAKDWKLKNFLELRPSITFWEIVKKYGFPQMRHKVFGKKKSKKVMRSFVGDKRPACCYYLKEKTRYAYYREHQVKGDIGGLRAGESRVRAIFIGMRGQYYTIKKPRPMTIYQPIALWNTAQCQAYIQEHNIPYNKTYDTQNRNGCWPCTGYKSWKENLKRYSPRMYRIIQNMRGVQLMDNYVYDQSYIPNQVPPCEQEDPPVD